MEEINGKNKRIMEKIKLGPKIDYTNFDWGWFTTRDIKQKEFLIQEIFEDRAYETYLEVEKNDIVVDIGASVGPFSYSILNKKPKRIICVEPSTTELVTLKSNIKFNNLTIVPYAISDINGRVDLQHIFGETQEINSLAFNSVQTITFNSLIKNYKINKIDFLKIDCEGGEYDVFNNENIWWLKDNCKKIVGEWHLGTPELKKKFRIFRDTYLRLFPKHKVFSVDGVDIKWDLWNEHFLEYYAEVIIHIDNRI